MDVVDQELFFDDYLDDIPFLRWELKPEKVNLKMKTGKSIKCKARTYMTVWQSGFLSVTMSLSFMKEKMYDSLNIETKHDVVCLDNFLSLDNILFLESFGFPDGDNPFMRKAQDIHHKVLTKLYRWNGTYEKLSDKLRYPKSDAWFLTTIFLERQNMLTILYLY